MRVRKARWNVEMMRVPNRLSQRCRQLEGSQEVTSYPVWRIHLISGKETGVLSCLVQTSEALNSSSLTKHSVAEIRGQFDRFRNMKTTIFFKGYLTQQPADRSNF